MGTVLRFQEPRMGERAWLGTIIRDLGFTHATLAKAMKVRKSQVARWEDGSSRPSVKNWVRLGNIAAVLGYPTVCLRLWQEAGVDTTLVPEAAGWAAELAAKGSFDCLLAKPTEASNLVMFHTPTPQGV